MLGEEIVCAVLLILSPSISCRSREYASRAMCVCKWSHDVHYSMVDYDCPREAFSQFQLIKYDIFEHWIKPPSQHHTSIELWDDADAVVWVCDVKWFLWEWPQFGIDAKHPNLHPNDSVEFMHLHKKKKFRLVRIGPTGEWIDDVRILFTLPPVDLAVN